MNQTFVQHYVIYGNTTVTMYVPLLQPGDNLYRIPNEEIRLEQLKMNRWDELIQVAYDRAQEVDGIKALLGDGPSTFSYDEFDYVVEKLMERIAP